PRDLHALHSFPTRRSSDLITLGDLAEQIMAFEATRDSLRTERVGVGLTRALYATYVSALPAERFVYDIAAHGDVRGVFVEVLKTDRKSTRLNSSHVKISYA